MFSLASDECVARDFGHGSVVCECNSTHCDSAGPCSLPGLGQFASYLSSKAGSRLERGQGRVLANSSGTGEALDPSRCTKRRRTEPVAPTLFYIFIYLMLFSRVIKSGVTCVALLRAMSQKSFTVAYHLALITNLNPQRRPQKKSPKFVREKRY